MQKVIRERDIERYLVAQAKKLGGEVRKVEWVGRRGAPDRLVMLPNKELFSVEDVARWFSVPMDVIGPLPPKAGAAIWIELKAPGVKPEAHQVREHERMRKMGQRVEVVDSFARVDEVLS